MAVWAAVRCPAVVRALYSSAISGERVDAFSARMHNRRSSYEAVNPFSRAVRTGASGRARAYRACISFAEIFMASRSPVCLEQLPYPRAVGAGASAQAWVQGPASAWLLAGVRAPALAARNA